MKNIKKTILLGLLVSSISAIASEGTNLYLGAGIVDIKTTFNKKVSENKKEEKLKGGEISAIAEVTKECYPNLELGLGTSYQKHNKKSDTGRNYNSVPIYGVAKYNFTVSESVVPYLKLNCGYSFNFDEKEKNTDGVNTKMKVNNGIYYGIGGGIEYNNFIVELMYKVNKSDVKFENNQENISKHRSSYYRTTLAIGYKFNF